MSDWLDAYKQSIYIAVVLVAVAIDRAIQWLRRK